MCCVEDDDADLAPASVTVDSTGDKNDISSWAVSIKLCRADCAHIILAHTKVYLEIFSRKQCNGMR
jgi:hypothetical protein